MVYNSLSRAVSLLLEELYFKTECDGLSRFIDLTATMWRRPAAGGVLPYMGYIGMCRCEGYGFQAVYSRIGYINQSVWL